MTPGLGLVILLLFNVHYLSVDASEVGNFQINSCSDATVRPILEESNVSKILQPSRFLSCAADCHSNEECHHAIFKQKEQSCQHVMTAYPSIQKTKRMALKTDCTVLSKEYGAEESFLSLSSPGTGSCKENRISLPQCPVEKWKTVTVNDYRNLQEQKLSLTVRQRDSVRAGLSVAASSHGLMVTSHRFLAVSQSLNIQRPFAFIFEAIYEESGDHMKAEIDLVGRTLQYKRVKSSNDFDMAMRETSVPDGYFTFYFGQECDGVSDVINALKLGYRRLERYPTRVEIDLGGEDAHFDMTGTFNTDSVDDSSTPLYYSSIKESVKHGKRYIFRHQIHKGNTLPYEETDTDNTWIMDTCWTKLDKEGSSKDLFQLLMENILQGKDIRVMINGTISSDITGISTSQDEIFALLAPYLTPVAGQTATDAPKTTIRFSAISFSNKLVECEMSYQESEVLSTSENENVGVEWFVSTRTWTRLISLEKSKVSYGSKKDLLDGVKSGRHIRVCYGGSTYASCFTPTKIFAGSEDSIAAMSPADVFVHKSGGKVEKISSGCQKSIRLVSISGKLQMAKFTIGLSSEALITFSLQQQSWFIEE